MIIFVESIYICFVINAIFLNHSLAFKLSSTDINVCFILFYYFCSLAILLTSDSHELLLFWLPEPLFWIYEAVSPYSYCISLLKHWQSDLDLSFQ